MIQQEQNDLYQMICSNMKDNNTDLSKVCRTLNLDYQDTYRRLTRSVVDYEWLCLFVDKALPGVELQISIQ